MKLKILNLLTIKMRQQAPDMHNDINYKNLPSAVGRFFYPKILSLPRLAS